MNMRPARLYHLGLLCLLLALCAPGCMLLMPLRAMTGLRNDARPAAPLTSDQRASTLDHVRRFGPTPVRARNGVRQWRPPHPPVDIDPTGRRPPGRENFDGKYGPKNYGMGNTGPRYRNVYGSR